MNTINFATLTQAVLFEFEIKGQLSDGAWENAQPYDHWRNWCNAEVGVDSENLGRNFWVSKDGYLLSSLVEYVGERMIRYAKMALSFPDEVAKMMEAGVTEFPRNPEDYEWTLDKATDPAMAYPQYYQKRIEVWDECGFDGNQIANAEYDEEDLRKDLAAIRKTMKIQR